jgi:hypothetical protein
VDNRLKYITLVKSKAFFATARFFRISPLDIPGLGIEDKFIPLSRETVFLAAFQAAFFLPFES